MTKTVLIQNEKKLERKYFLKIKKFKIYKSNYQMFRDTIFLTSIH